MNPLPATALAEPAPVPRAALPAALARLLREPQAFEFHQAVRLAAHWLAWQPAPGRAALRFRNGNSLAFPASELQALEVEPGEPAIGGGEAPGSGGEAGAAEAAGTSATSGTSGTPGASERAGLRRLNFTPAFMGLLGAAGALPLAYGEQIAAHEAQHRDAAARGFLDIFQHRAVALFHASWRRHRLALQAEAQPGDDRTLALLLSLCGLMPDAVRGRVEAQGSRVAIDVPTHAATNGATDAASQPAAVPAAVLAHYAGLLQRPGVGASALQRVLADYFQVPVRIRQFVGRWCELPADSRCRLGSAQAVLAGSAVLGERTWQRDLRLRLVLGPLDAAQLNRFLPNQHGARALRELLALAAGTSLECEVAFRLLAPSVARARLGGSAGAPAGDGATRLGWNGFLLSRASAAPREETVYELHPRPA